MVFHILLISTQIGKLLQCICVSTPTLASPSCDNICSRHIHFLAGCISGYTELPRAKKIPTSSDTSVVDTTTPVKTGDATVSSKFVVDEHFIDPDNNCEDCTRMVYTPGSQKEAE